MGVATDIFGMASGGSGGKKKRGGDGGKGPSTKDANANNVSDPVGDYAKKRGSAPTDGGGGALERIERRVGRWMGKGRD